MPAQTPPHAVRAGAGLAPREDWPSIGDSCAIVRTLDVVSTRTAFLILREAFYGATRFDQFTERAEISEPVAAARLRDLTQAGLLVKVPYREPGQRTRSEYHLSEKGADLWPVLVALWDWGDRWTFRDGAGVQFDHIGCGAQIHARVLCDEGHPVSREETEIVRRH